MMEIIEVNVTSYAKQNLSNKIIQRLVRVVLFPLVIIFVLFLFLIAPIIDFVLRKINGGSDNSLAVSHDDVLFEDNNLTIFREPITYGVEQLAEDFKFAIVNYSEDMVVYKLRLTSEINEMHGAFVTGLYIDLEDEVILQRITKKEGSPSSELIGFNKGTKEVHIYRQIGLYDLYEFNSVTREILGSNKSESIRIKIE